MGYDFDYWCRSVWTIIFGIHVLCIVLLLAVDIGTGFSGACVNVINDISATTSKVRSKERPVHTASPRRRTHRATSRAPTGA